MLNVLLCKLNKIIYIYICLLRLLVPVAVLTEKIKNTQGNYIDA